MFPLCRVQKKWRKGTKWNLLCKCHDSARCAQHPLAIFQRTKGPPVVAGDSVTMVLGADCFGPAGGPRFLLVESQSPFTSTHARLAQTKVNKSQSQKQNRKYCGRMVNFWPERCHLNFTYLCAYFWLLESRPSPST